MLSFQLSYRDFSSSNLSGNLFWSIARAHRSHSYPRIRVSETDREMIEPADVVVGCGWLNSLIMPLALREGYLNK